LINCRAIPRKDKDFSPPKNSGSHQASYPKITGDAFPGDLSGRAAKLTTYLYLLATLRMTGSLPTLPYTHATNFACTGVSRKSKTLIICSNCTWRSSNRRLLGSV